MKRAFDLFAALFGLLLLAPLLVAIGAAVRFTSRGPAIHRGRRVGRREVPFEVLKFRSMRIEPDASQAPLTRAADPRITPLGRFLRRTRLDELPQLVNVVRGEMSLVGPRPEDPRYVAFYDERQKRLLQIRPGITSPASLAYRDESSLLGRDDWEETYVREILPRKLEIDLGYFGTRPSFSSDLRILLATVASVFRG